MTITINSAVARFLSKISPNTVTGCWNWTGYKMKNGYGQMFFEGRMRLAHRASFKMHHGSIPQGLDVCHRCDNPACVNPDHLFLGTPAENTADMIAKGRQPAPERTRHQGESNGRAKLTEKDVISIRRAKSAKGLAEQYGVGKTLIYDIRAGKHWLHIEAHRSDNHA